MNAHVRGGKASDGVLVPQIKTAVWLPLRVMFSPDPGPSSPVSPNVSDQGRKVGHPTKQFLIPHQIRDSRHDQGSQQTATDAVQAHTGPQGVPPPQQVAASSVLLFRGCLSVKVEVRSLATIDVRKPARVRRPRASAVNCARPRSPRLRLLLKAAVTTMYFGGWARVWGCQRRTGRATVQLANRSRPRSSPSASSGTMSRHVQVKLVAVVCNSRYRSPRRQRDRIRHLGP